MSKQGCRLKNPAVNENSHMQSRHVENQAAAVDYLACVGSGVAEPSLRGSEAP